MRDFDWLKVWQNKEEQRAALAALPFPEKLRFLELLRRREHELRELRPGGGVTVVASCAVNWVPPAQSSAPGVFITFGANETFVAAATAGEFESEAADMEPQETTLIRYSRAS